MIFNQIVIFILLHNLIYLIQASQLHIVNIKFQLDVIKQFNNIQNLTYIHLLIKISDDIRNFIKTVLIILAFFFDLIFN